MKRMDDFDVRRTLVFAFYLGGTGERRCSG